MDIFKGYYVPDLNIFKITLDVSIPALDIDKKPVDFLIDTGASLSGIYTDDAINLNILSFDKTSNTLINFHNLDINDINRIDSPVEVLDVNNEIVLEKDGKVFTKLDNMFVLKPEVFEPEMLMDLNILGMDALFDYRIEFNNDEAILEKRS